MATSKGPTHEEVQQRHKKSVEQNLYSCTPETKESRNDRYNRENNPSPDPTPSPTDEEKRLEKGYYKIINDPIHGHIQLESILIKIIDTPQFQRLRDIKQLGCTYRVFPGASHNRFEHAIGACHMAGELVQVIMQSPGGDVVEEVDVMCFKIAALCYNLGYGPFSHVFSEMCIEEGLDWNLEKVSVVMFQNLIQENIKLKSELKKVDIREPELHFIEALMDPSLELPDEKKNMTFLRKVVRDQENSIDALTLDSIARDSYLLNIPSSFDHKRLVKFVRLINEPDCGDFILCYREIEARDLYSMFLSRLNLETIAYKHKTVQLLEWMLKKALKKANETLGLTQTVSDLLSEDEIVRNRAARKYTRIKDCVMEQIMCSSDSALNESREIWENIEKRQLQKFIGTVKTEKSDQEQDEDPHQPALKKLQEEIEKHEDFKECEVLVVEHRFGTKQCKNPVENVYFYYKSDPTTPIKLKVDQVSKILPNVFVEVALRVYHKRMADRSVYEKIARDLKRLIEEKYRHKLKWTGVLTRNGGSSVTPQATGSPPPLSLPQQHAEETDESLLHPT